MSYKNLAGYILQGKDKYQHRLIAEDVLGRKLRHGEDVHHVDGNPANNAHTNLVICSHALHMTLHARTRIVERGGNPDSEYFCRNCETMKKLEEFSKNKRKWNGRHDICKICMSKIKQSKGYNLWANKTEAQKKHALDMQTRRRTMRKLGERVGGAV